MRSKFQPIAGAFLLLASSSTLLTLATPPAAAQRGGASQVAVSAAAPPVARGATGTVTVTLNVKPGWHVYAAEPGADSYIPTTVAATPDAGVTVGKAAFPKPIKLKTPTDPKPVNVYEGKAIITVPITVAKTAKPGSHALKITVGYQTCNDKMCLPPTSVPVTANITVK